MRSALPVLALSLLLVTAGCNFDAGGGTVDPSGPSVTPAPLPPTDTPSPSPTPTPPQLSNPSERAFDHAATLENRSFTVREYREIRFANGTRYHERETNTTVAADETRFRLDSTTRSNASSFPSERLRNEVYSNGTLAAYRIQSAGRNDSGVFWAQDGEPSDPRDIFVRTPTNSDRILAVFALVSNVSVRETESHERITATRFVQSRFVVDGVEIRNVTLESFGATVEDGLVRKYRLVLRGTVGGERVRAIEYVRYSGVGEVVVEEPPWFDRVVANATES